jgi:hypothetical protein
MDHLAPSLAVLSAMITPAVLISACGTLILSTSQRLGRVMERVRIWSDRLDAALPSTQTGEVDRETVTLAFAQLDDTARRVRLLQWALTAFYVAVGVFVADMVTIGVMALTKVDAVWPTVGMGLLGAGLLFFGCIVLIGEARLALITTYREMAFVSRHGTERVPRELRRRRRGIDAMLARFSE